jgi:predicted aminopeptidase
VAKYEARLARLEQSRVAIEGTADRLRVVYEGTLSDEEKRIAKARELARLKGRLQGLRSEWNGGLKGWIEKPINNARLNAFTTYETEVKRFVDLLEACGGDFGVFWGRLGNP